ncbi:hypothetical protein [Candidatus Palauibacter sp.]|uniref:hypothetical protein n=1 Tax=Candidatus Palauibacter sp. TaxID=3101350 RepID=UPI003B010B19
MYASSTTLVGSSVCLAAFVAGIATFPSPPAGTSLAPQADALEGAWAAHEYVLATGPRHPVRGRIMFTSGEWQVLFFVMDGDEPKRGSGEGGRYTFDGETLTFEHLHHLSIGRTMAGLPASPLAMTAREDDGPLEPTGVEIDGDELRLLFPSGNSMSFIRIGG